MLSRHAGNASLLDLGQSIVDAVVQNLTYPDGMRAAAPADAGSTRRLGAGTLREPCESSGCGMDGAQFKGIFMRYLAEFTR